MSSIEMNEFIYFIIIAFSLCLMHHFCKEKVVRFMNSHHINFMSLAGGIMISILFFILLPETIELSHHLESSSNIFIWMLLGFGMFHLSENVIAKKARNENKREVNLRELYELGFFIDHFVVGFIVVQIIDFSNPVWFLMLIPIVIEIFTCTVCMDYIHDCSCYAEVEEEYCEDLKSGEVVSLGHGKSLKSKFAMFNFSKSHESKFGELMWSSAPLLGTFTGLVFHQYAALHCVLSAISFGLLLYMVIQDIVPRENAGSPLLFIIGIAIVTIIYFLQLMASTGAH